mmetsp:Transcript_64725/g.97495  ORF Transcript_64725/g.97495 Transcript_64725/m.97495 type:complete len:86 (+) Transcript_64725:209-466(+)
MVATRRKREQEKVDSIFSLLRIGSASRVCQSKIESFVRSTCEKSKRYTGICTEQKAKEATTLVAMVANGKKTPSTTTMNVWMIIF